MKNATQWAAITVIAVGVVLYAFSVTALIIESNPIGWVLLAVTAILVSAFVLYRIGRGRGNL